MSVRGLDEGPRLCIENIIMRLVFGRPIQTAHTFCLTEEQNTQFKAIAKKDRLRFDNGIRSKNTNLIAKYIFVVECTYVCICVSCHWYIKMVIYGIH